LKTFSEQKKLTLNLQILCELASVYWELGKVKEAQETQQSMKGFPLSMQITPLSRSRYLASIECTFQKASLNQVTYHLTLRINRELPLRKENDPVEDPVSISRRLESCFLVVTFEPTSPQTTDVIQVNFQVTKAISHSFEVRSPPLPAPDPGKLYEVSFEIYDNEGNRKLLGTHHQLVIPTQAPLQQFRLN